MYDSIDAILRRCEGNRKLSRKWARWDAIRREIEVAVASSTAASYVLLREEQPSRRSGSRGRK